MVLKFIFKEFSGSPVVWTLRFHCGEARVTFLVRGTKIPQAAQGEKKVIEKVHCLNGNIIMLTETNAPLYQKYKLFTLFFLTKIYFKYVYSDENCSFYLN